MSEHTADKDAPSMGQWARDVADTYREQAAAEGIWEPRRVALTAEAAKYDGIADRMNRIPRVFPPGEGTSR